MKRFISLILTVNFILISSVFAAPTIDKSETVYVNLGYYGDAEQIHVFNDCIVTGQESITEYGEYENIKNLSNHNEAIIKDNAITWSVKGLKEFYYSGKADNNNIKNVPWNFNIEYKLNGVPMTAEELIGKSGTIEIIVDINANKEANEYYRNNYMLEVTGSFDLDKYLSFEADEAMFLTTGRTKTLMYIVLPGQSTTLHIRIGSDNFEMDGLTFAMIPVEGEMLKKIGDIVKDKEDLEAAMDSINDSTDVILTAMNEMTPNLNKMEEGMSTVQSGTLELYDMTDRRDENLKDIKVSLTDMHELVKITQKDLDNVIKIVNNLTGMLESIQPKFKELTKKTKLIEGNLEDLEDIIEDLPDNVDEMQNFLRNSQSLISNTINLLSAQKNGQNIETDTLKDNLTEIASSAYGILRMTPEQFAMLNQEDIAGLSPEKQEAALILRNLLSAQTILSDIEETVGSGVTASNSMISNLGKIRSNLSEFEDMLDEDDAEIIVDSVSNMRSLIKSMNGILDILIKYNEKFIDSKDDIPDAIHNLQDILEELNKLNKTAINLLTMTEDTLKIVDDKIYKGSDDMISGLMQVTGDLRKITSESNKLKNSKNEVRNIVKDRLDEVDDKTTIFNIDTDAKPVSFLSNKNDSPSKVQFMLKTPEIKAIAVHIEDFETNATNEGFWSRLIAVFKKIIDWITGIFKF